MATQLATQLSAPSLAATLPPDAGPPNGRAASSRP
jgi:hypothetical protein